MRIVWSSRWFLDYRISVFKALSQIPGVEFYMLYNKTTIPDRVHRKMKSILGDRAIGFSDGEVNLVIGNIAKTGDFANKYFRIPYQKRLLKTIIDLKPDVLIGDGFFQWTFPNIFLRATKGIPHVMLYERTKHTERNAQLLRRIYRQFSMKFIDVICCSGALCAEYIKSLGFPADRITLRHMVADVGSMIEKGELLTIKEINEFKTKLGAKGLVYFYSGQMVPRKGVKELLTAWRDYTTIVGKDNVTLILVGEGLHLDEYKKMSSPLENVHFEGRVDYDEIHLYYSASDIFIMPTLEDNWSLVVPEAMSFGLPIITSIYNGCWPELVTNENGWVIDTLNHKKFIDTLLESYKSKDLLKGKGKISKIIVSEHTPKIAAQNIFNSCLIAVKNIGSPS